MARQPRIEYSGAFYHVMARGNRREAIFLDAEDCKIFLKTLEEAAERSGWQVYAWVLMGNHYHLAIHTPNPTLVEGMKWFQNTYTRRFNTRHRVWGHLFGGRYKAIPVEGENQEHRNRSSDYLMTLIDYIHLNPARAGLLTGKEEAVLGDYQWSSFSRDYSAPPASRKPWMAVSEGLKLFGFNDDTVGRRRFRARLEKQVKTQDSVEETSRQAAIERGWCLGSEVFQQRLLSLLERTNGNRNYQTSRVAREKRQITAIDWLEKGKQHFGILLPAKGREAYRDRVAIAWAIHRKTNQPQAWIAEMLGLHTAANVSQQVRRFQKYRENRDTLHPEETDKLLESWIAVVENC